MGTFDILNMRTNGYQFHIDLMAGKGSWESAEVKKVFDTWAQLLPVHQPDPLGRTWQEASQTLQQKKAGMYLLGTFLIDQFPQNEREDIDLFTFPVIDPAVGADALDAPIDGFCMSAEPKNEAGAKKLLAYLASPDASAQASALGEPFISSNTKSDTSKYTTLQKKSAELVGQAKNIAQFLDRDTRPDFASTVIIPAFQDFIRNPGNAASILRSIESQKKTIFVE
jgi:multiple sugar transport system substrate-binding protein